MCISHEPHPQRLVQPGNTLILASSRSRRSCGQVEPGFPPVLVNHLVWLISVELSLWTICYSFFFGHLRTRTSAEGHSFLISGPSQLAWVLVKCNFELQSTLTGELSWQLS